MAWYNYIGESLKYLLEPKLANKVDEPFVNQVVKPGDTTEFGGAGSPMDVDVVNASQLSTIFQLNYASEQTINEVIKTYRNMTNISLVQKAVAEIVNTAIMMDDLGDREVIKIRFDEKTDALPDTLKTQIVKEWNYLLEISEFYDKGTDIFKQWYIDGRLVTQLILNKKDITKGIQNIKIMSPFECKRYFDSDKKQKFWVYGEEKQVNNYDYSSGMQTDLQIIPDNLMIYTPSGLFDTNKRTPISYLHFAIKDVNRLNTLEDHILIYRIVRSPERRVFYIDPGQLPPKKAEEYLKQVMDTHKQQKYFDEGTGSLAQKTKHPAMLEDYFLLRREGKGTAIETLPGATQLGEIEDLIYFQKKAAASLFVPFSRLNFEDRGSQSTMHSPTGNELTIEEAKFYRYITNLRRTFNDFLIEMLHKQLIFKGIIKENEWKHVKKKLYLKYATDAGFLEEQKLRVLERKLGILRDIQEYKGKWFTVEQIYKDVLNMSDEEIERFETKLHEEKTKYKEDNTANNGF